MALAALDPDTALVVVDLQKGIVGHPVARPIEGAIDAMTDTRAEAHDHGIRSVVPRLGETGSTDAILALSERNAR